MGLKGERVGGVPSYPLNIITTFTYLYFLSFHGFYLIEILEPLSLSLSFSLHSPYMVCYSSIIFLYKTKAVLIVDLVKEKNVFLEESLSVSLSLQVSHFIPYIILTFCH